MIITLTIIITILLLYYEPKIDKTNQGDILLWYGHCKRKYIILWKE